jgi:hypothetical protein
LIDQVTFMHVEMYNAFRREMYSTYAKSYEIVLVCHIQKVLL